MAIKYSTKVAQLRSRLYKENRPGKEGHPPSPDSFLACGPRMKRWQTSYLAKLVSLAYKLSLRTSFSTQLKRFATQANEHKKSVDPSA